MPDPLIHALLAQLAEPFTGEALFDALHDVLYFFKNARGEYVLVNQTLARRCGVADKANILGKTAADLYPGELGKNYYAQDLALIETGAPLLNELELHLYPTGEPGWCITTKLPLKNRAQECIGLVGISRDLHAPTDDYRDVP